MKQNKIHLLIEQINTITDNLNVIGTQFYGEFENFLLTTKISL